MKVMVSSTGPDIDSEVSPVFGRAEYYLMVDSEDLTFESFENPSLSQDSGAGIMAARFVLEKGPESLISSNIGPKAFDVLSAGSVKCFTAKGGTVGEAVESFVRGELRTVEGATAPSHTGIGGRGVRKTPEGKATGDDPEELVARLRQLRDQVGEIAGKLEEIEEG